MDDLTLTTNDGVNFAKSNLLQKQSMFKANLKYQNRGLMLPIIAETAKRSELYSRQTNQQIGAAQAKSVPSVATKKKGYKIIFKDNHQ